MSRTVTVYSKPSGCPQCVATKRTLERGGVEYEAISLADIEPELMAQFRAWGHTEAPVVLIHDDGKLIANWSGFQPGKLEKYTEGL